MESIEYEIIEFVNLEIGNRFLNIIIRVIGIAIFFFTFFKLFSIDTIHISDISNLILVLSILFLVNFFTEWFYYKRTFKFNKKGKFIITNQGIEIHLFETKKYFFTELKRIYYKYDKAEFDFGNKSPKALTYEITIIDFNDIKTIIKILRKFNKNNIYPDIRNDLETILEELRKSNYKIYQVIRSAD